MYSHSVLKYNIVLFSYYITWCCNIREWDSIAFCHNPFNRSVDIIINFMPTDQINNLATQKFNFSIQATLNATFLRKVQRLQKALMSLFESGSNKLFDSIIV